MLSYLLISFCLFFTSHQTKTPAPVIQTSLLYRHWIHSQEEDNSTQGTITYRPSTYSFPPARGRDGFELKKGGAMLSHQIAAADGNRTVQEKWKLKKNELTMTGKSSARRFKIVSLTQDKLILKRL